jgi:hypothetical protein
MLINELFPHNDLLAGSTAPVLSVPLTHIIILLLLLPVRPTPGILHQQILGDLHYNVLSLHQGYAFQALH